MRSTSALLRRHAALVALVAVAAALRVLALVAVYPGIWFSDGNNFVETAATGRLSPMRVTGYSLYVAPFWRGGSAAALIVSQHVLGLAMVVLLYALLVRRGVKRLLALLAVVPLALDAYLIQIEHTIMSETIFHAALVGALVVLLWKDRPGLTGTAVAGVLLGYAGAVRSVAVPLVVVFLLYLLVRRVGWRRVAAFAVGWSLVVGGYATVYKVQHGVFGMTQYGAHFLYGRTAPFADCSRLAGLPANERYLCPDPTEPMTTNRAMWGEKSPIRERPLSENGAIRDFALRVIRDQPLTYARIVALDFLHYFEPGHRIGPNDPQIVQWQFPADPNSWGSPGEHSDPNHPGVTGYRGPIRPADTPPKSPFDPNRYVSRMVDEPHTNVAASRFLHGYQRFAFTSGLVLGICLLVVLLAVLSRRGAARLRLDAALIATSVVVMLLVSAALSVFSYRYGLVAAVLLPAAAALATTALKTARGPSDESRGVDPVEPAVPSRTVT